MRRCTIRLADGPAAPITKMVKSFKLFEVTSQCAIDDCIFARKLPGGGCQFFAWTGLPQHLAAQGILTMPPHLQTVHALFGRNDVPVDICADIDCPVPPEAQTVESVKRFQKKVLEQHVTALHDAIAAEGEAIETQVCLQSPNLKKASFHIHIKLKDAAFADHRSLLGFMQTTKGKGNAPHLDLQIFRINGMLRMFKSKKENLQSPIGFVEDSAFQIGFPSGKVSDIDAAVHSLCTRAPKTFSRLIQKAPAIASGSFNPTSDATMPGAQQRTQRTQAVAPRTNIEACENAKKWILESPPEAVRDWKNWVAMGMSTYRVAHHFRDAKVPSFRGSVNDELLAAWIETSKKVPQKFVPGDCERAWATFVPEPRSDSWWISYKSLFNSAHRQRY